MIVVSEAFFLHGQGQKNLPEQGPIAKWSMQIPIGTFAISAKVDIRNISSSTVDVKGFIETAGPALIPSETVGETGELTLQANARGQVVLQGTAATNQPATVTLTCQLLGGSSGGRVVVSGGKVTVNRLQDPDRLDIRKPQVQ